MGKFNTLYLSAGGSVLTLSGDKPGALHVQRGNVFYTRFAVYRAKTTCKALVIEYSNGVLVTR